MRPRGAEKARNYCTATPSAGFSVPQRNKQRADFPLVFLSLFFGRILIKALIGKDKVKREREGGNNFASSAVRLQSY